MSNLSDLLPSGSGGKQVEFVASGAISSGDTVTLNVDGTISAIPSGGTGQPTLFVTDAPQYIATAYDSTNGKVIVAYRDGGDGTAIVGTVVGTDIVFGDPVVFNTGTTTSYYAATYDATNERIVIAYTDAGDDKAIVGTVSGTSISFGTPVAFAVGQNTTLKALTFDSNTSKVVIAYNNTSSSIGQAKVGTVSGTSISFGSPATFESASVNFLSAVFDNSVNRVVLAYRDGGNSNYGTAVVGSVSGTSITFGTPTVFNSAGTEDTALAYGGNRVVVTYSDGNGKAKVFNVSTGNSYTSGAEATFAAIDAENSTVAYDNNLNVFTVVYVDVNDSRNVKATIGTRDGTDITFTTPFALVGTNGTAGFPSAVYDINAEQIVVAYRDSSDTNGTAIVVGTTGVETTSFVGIADEAISDTASGSVTIKGGISTNVTGLTPNATYYVQSDGSLSTTESGVLAGKALSSTSINLDYTT